MHERRGVARLFGDNRYLLAARVLAEGAARGGAPAWLYYIDFPATEPQGASPGAPHGFDGALLFRSHDSEVEPLRRLGARLTRHWLAFARTGAPDPEANPEWPRWEADGDRWLALGPAGDRSRVNPLGERMGLLLERYRARVAPALR